MGMSSAVFSRLGSALPVIKRRPNRNLAHGFIQHPTTRRYVSWRPSSKRIEAFQLKLRQRYPDLSAHQLPSITAAFLVLHELTAIVPLLTGFFVLHTTGTGERIVHWLKSATCSDQQDQVPDGLANRLRSSTQAALDEGAQKISRLAVKYGSIEFDEKTPGAKTEKVLERVDSSIVASGLAAYFLVKVPDLSLPSINYSHRGKSFFKPTSAIICFSFILLTVRLVHWSWTGATSSPGRTVSLLGPIMRSVISQTDLVR